MLIDRTFFFNEIHIPNLNEVCENPNSLFNIQIAQWEDDFYQKVFGSCLYDEFMSAFKIENNQYVLDEEGGNYEFYNNLLNGETYTHGSGCGCGCSCEERTWKGLIYKVKVPTGTEIKEVKYSPMAYYIWYNWANINNSQTTGTGEQVNEVSNAYFVTNHKKRILNWNNFQQWVNGCKTNRFVSLYEYLHDKEKPTCGFNFKPLSLWT